MANLNASPVELVLRCTNEHIDIMVCDAAGCPIDAAELELIILDQCERIIHVDAFPTFTLTGTVTVLAGTVQFTGVGSKYLTELRVGDVITVATEVLTVATVVSDTQFTTTAVHVAGAAAVTFTKATRIVKPAGTTGQYYFDFGSRTAPINIPTQTETARLGDFLFQWAVVGAIGGERETVIQVVKVVSPTVLRMVTYFRSQIDKAAKRVNTSPTDFCPLGYTNSDLLGYLYGGISIINAYQPYPTWCRLESFPECFWQTLFDAALVVGINAQTLFAIDSDIESWSDQGNAFVINHQPKLAAFSQTLSQRLDTLIPKMKLHFVNSGVLHTEMGPNWRLNVLLDSAPAGALFRNLFVAGGA